MKFTSFIACLIVTIDCADHALGNQSLFSNNFSWVWWIVAAFWALSTLTFFVAWITKTELK